MTTVQLVEQPHTAYQHTLRLTRDGSNRSFNTCAAPCTQVARTGVSLLQVQVEVCVAVCVAVRVAVQVELQVAGTGVRLRYCKSTCGKSRCEYLNEMEKTCSMPEKIMFPGPVPCQHRSDPRKRSAPCQHRSDPRKRKNHVTHVITSIVLQSHLPHCRSPSWIGEW